MVSFSRFTRYFTEVARLGSIRKAAEVLHVSASAIDRQLLAAEEEFGVPLFERLPSGMRLTAAGEILIGATRQWQKDYGRVFGQMAELQGLKRGHVDIAVIDALADGFVPEAIARMTAEFPRITYAIQVRDNADIARSIIAGEVDFGLLLEPVSNAELTVRAHVNIPLGITTAPGHILDGRAGVRLNQAVGYTMIMPDKPLMIYERAAALAATTGFGSSKSISSNNIRMMRSLIKQGAGIGILSWLDVMTDVKNQTLAFIPLTDSMLRPMTLSLCVASRRRLSKAASMTMHYMESQMTALEVPVAIRPRAE